MKGLDGGSWPFKKNYFLKGRFSCARTTFTKPRSFCEFASLGSQALDERLLPCDSVLPPPLPPPPSLQQSTLSGTLGIPPGLLRSIKNRVCPCRWKTLKCKGKLSKKQFGRHNSALNICSQEHSDHLIALSQEKPMLSVPLHSFFPLP